MMFDERYELLLWLWGIVLAIVFTTLLQDPLHFFIARSFRRLGIRSKRQLSGVWRIQYHGNPPPPAEIPNDFIRVKQAGSFLAGQTQGESARKFSIRAEISNDEYVTGYWNSTMNNNTYHGAFQLKIEPSGLEMSGKWIGFTREGVVRVGDWSWHLNPE
jgi:hypothetical protein